ncbi:hypothetical protein ACS0TY_033814 [Phlomoides rotata]
MAKIRDRTEDFKDAARRAALNLEYNESKIAAIMASFIMHKMLERSSFTKAALTTLENIRALEQFLLKHKKDYVDAHRTTEQERDSIEHEVTVFIKACKDQIDVLKNSIIDEEAKSKGWLGIKSDNLNADTVAHKHGVVLILSEKLHLVTSQFDQLRGLRFQEAINRATPRRKPKQSGPTAVAENSTSGNMDLRENNTEVRQTDGVEAEPIKFQQQQLDDETRALQVTELVHFFLNLKLVYAFFIMLMQVELGNMLDAVQETETKMVEMSALNHLMSTHVLQQAQQIEYLYDQAVEATNNVVLGNKELAQAIQRNSSSRTFLLLFLFVLTFSVLFLDWYS